MDFISNLSMGFGIALSPINLLVVTVGVIVGTLIGALPGIGPVAALSILIPLVFGMDPISAMILMCGIYYGCMYGGTITSVLMNVPGESSSLMTCLDGNAMARQGRAGPALTIAAIASFVAGTFSVVMLTRARAADRRVRPELRAAGILRADAARPLGDQRAHRRARARRATRWRSLGLALAMVGLDPIDGTQRFTFGNLELMDGIGFLPDRGRACSGSAPCCGMIEKPRRPRRS